CLPRSTTEASSSSAGAAVEAARQRSTPSPTRRTGTPSPPTPTRRRPTATRQWPRPRPHSPAGQAPPRPSARRRCPSPPPDSSRPPTTSVAFAEAAQRAGLPDGVINVVSGTGPVAGEALVTHRDVRMVSFTGSTRAGSRVGSLAAGLVKRVHLELGGKAPFVVFDDA